MNETEDIRKIFTEFGDIFTKKNVDYGNSFAEFGVLGVVIRMNDKMNRIKQLIKNGKENREVKDETIEDTIRDLGVYCGMCLMLLKQEESEDYNQ